MQHYEEYEGDIYHTLNESYEFRCPMPGSFYDYRFNGDMLITADVWDCPNYDGEERIDWVIWRIPSEQNSKCEPIGGSVGSWYFHPSHGEDQCVWDDAEREVEWIRSKE